MTKDQLKTLQHVLRKQWLAEDVEEFVRDLAKAGYGVHKVGDLSDKSFVSKKASRTSRSAAKYVLPRTGTQMREVLNYIASQGDATCPEVVEALGGLHQSLSARIRDLVQRRLLVDTGEERSAPGRPPARVYALSQAALDTTGQIISSRAAEAHFQAP